MGKIKFRRPLELGFPTLDEGEPGFTRDTDRFFIGSSQGNIEIAKKNDLDTTNTNLADVVKKQQNVYIDVTKPPPPLTGIDFTETDVVPKLNSIVSSITTGAIRLFFPDGTYNLMTNFAISNRDVYLLGSFNAIINKTASVNAINISGSFDLDLVITAINTDKKTITVDTTNLSVGDVVEIYSSDTIPNKRYTTYQGEFGVVSTIPSSGTIVLTAPLRPDFTYATSPRLRRLAKYKTHITGLKFNDTVSVFGTDNVINLTNLYKPKVDFCRNIFSRNTFIAVNECYGYEIYKCWSENERDTGLDSSGYLGYGISDQGSGFGVVDSCYFSHLRHGFTTNANTSGKGETHYTTIRNCIAVGTTSQSFDTHEDGYKITFDNCHAYNSAFAGFAARTETKFKSCRAVNCNKGFYLFNYSSVKSCQKVRLYDCIVENCADNPINISDQSNVNAIVDVEVVGGHYDGLNMSISLGTNIRFKNVTIKSTNNYMNRIFSGSDVTYVNCAFEFDNPTQYTEYYLFDVEGNSTVKAINCFWRNATNIMLIALGNDATTNNVLKVKGMVVDGQVKLISSVSCKQSTPANFSTLSLDYSLL